MNAVIFIRVTAFKNIMKIYLIDYNYNDWYYVGKTKYTLEHRFSGHKWASKNKKSLNNKVFHKSLNPEIILLEETTPDLVDELERFYISYLKFLGVKLTNLTDGGDGGYNRIFSEEHKLKIGLKRTGVLHSNLGKLNISKGNMGKKRSEEFKENVRQRRLNTQWDENTKSKISKSNIGKHTNNNRAIPITQFSKDGEFINEFGSITEASYIINKEKYKSVRIGIEACCNPNSKQKTAYGYIWKYKR